MASESRLDRLRKLIQTDVDALPDRSALSGSVVHHEDSSILSDGTSQPPVASGTQPQTKTPPRAAVSPAHANRERRFVLIKDAASSYNPRTLPQASVLPKPSAKLLTTKLRQGDIAPTQLNFTPIRALARFPYRTSNQGQSRDIAATFFDGGKFWAREWDLYYIWDTELLKTLILVSESQFQDLIEEINAHFKLNLMITDSQRGEGLVSRFPDHPDCRPRYLGRSHSREQFDNFVAGAPNIRGGHASDDACEPPDNATLEHFRQLMEACWDVQKAKSKAKKEEQRQKRLRKQEAMVDQLNRAQQHLGLRPTATVRNTSSTCSESAPAINFSAPTPFAFDRSVVFVCIDVESWERAHHKIIEVGVATLDTRDLVGVAPGKDGNIWSKKIKARHFRIREHRHLVNSAFVAGCPDGFDFGDSTFVTLKDAPLHIAACFQPPFGVHASNTSGEEELNNILRALDLDEKRNLVLLGHDTSGDIRYLQMLGFNIMDIENIIEVMDTARMYQGWRREQQATSLGKILAAFDIIGWRLHNAGNDAVYTLQIMLAMCVQAATTCGSPELEVKRNEVEDHKPTTSHEAPEQRAKANPGSWSDDESVKDGGVPIPIHS